MDPMDRVCIVTFDEVSLSRHLQYDKENDKIIGFEDFGDRRSEKFADHSLVYMLRGIHTGWKIPIFYAFCDALTRRADLTRCFKRVVQAISAAGFKVVAAVCDQLGTNVKMMKDLVDDSNREQIKRGEERSKYRTNINFS